MAKYLTDIAYRGGKSKVIWFSHTADVKIGFELNFHIDEIQSNLKERLESNVRIIVDCLGR